MENATYPESNPGSNSEINKRRLTGLVSLNVSNSQITSAGLRHLKPLKNLRSLTLESCKVTANDIKRLQSRDLPNLPFSFYFSTIDTTNTDSHHTFKPKGEDQTPTKAQFYA
ncbi:hypothetical protein WN943_017930 [Citrus x changshan-huyou]